MSDTRVTVFAIGRGSVTVFAIGRGRVAFFGVISAFGAVVFAIQAFIAGATVTVQTVSPITAGKEQRKGEGENGCQKAQL